MDDTPTPALLGGRYRLLRRLGQGGMSAVHAARDEVLGRDVAVKMVHGDQVGEDDVRRLEREARAVAGLSHPHVVVVHDVLRDAGGAAIVMELVEGGTLADRIRDAAPLPWRDAVVLAVDVADGLQAAHAVGLVHRDVKPSNVLLGTDGRLKVADFGIAGLADASTHTTTIRGSIPYLAPEQARGERPDPRTDVYALGCVLHEMLTGQPPFADDHGAAIIGQHLHRAPDPPSRREPGVPPALDALVLRMLAKAPVDRPPDMATVRGALTAILDGDGRATATTAVLGGAGVGAGATTEVVGTTDVGGWDGGGPDVGARGVGGRGDGTPHESGDRRGRRLALVGGAGVALILALLVGWALRGPGDPDEPTAVASTPEAPATASPTPTPTETTPAMPDTTPSDAGPPERPSTIPEAAESFRRSLVAGRSDGQASGKAVEELDKLVTEILAKHREDKPKDVRDGADKLEEKIDELVEKGEVSEELGSDLRDASREFRRLAEGGPDG